MGCMIACFIFYFKELSLMSICSVLHCSLIVLLKLNTFRSPVSVKKYIQFLTVAMQLHISVDKT